jgi:hypothetical protein
LFCAPSAVLTFLSFEEVMVTDINTVIVTELNTVREPKFQTTVH